ncbi:MAG: glycosyltransferase [Leptolyngbyaceae cyanobacterium SL_1_1]|nr:glycosyltransferase [Leptolyngbyaceae cyanobacterium SL_1_1]
MLKVLHINQSDSVGGASIAGYRLHQGLIKSGASSKILVGSSNRSTTLTQTIPRIALLEAVLKRVFIPFGLNNLHIVNTWNIANHSFFLEADVVNFHNLHLNYFNYLAISKLTNIKPTVFRLPDMWSFTGHCAYSFDCKRWMTGCGQCPYLETYPAVNRDNTHLEWKLKKWTYNNSNLTIVTPSKWLAVKAQQSLLNCFPIHHIPNGLNVDLYQPLDVSMCRAVLDLPLEKRILAFAAQTFQDPRKGSDLLVAALQKLPAPLKKNLILMTLGEGGELLELSVDIPTVSLGYAGGDRLKAVAYSAADLFVFPTRADNLPLVLQESMACGTPMVSFDVGGVPELVRPGQTGLLAKPEDANDLAQKIIELLEDDTLRYNMGQKCREIAVAEYSLELQSERYIALYHQVIDNFHDSGSKSVRLDI